ncbi:MAG: hypothetical protein ABR564_02260 [Candidatus Dormibacteria bacterium]
MRYWGPVRLAGVAAAALVVACGGTTSSGDNGEPGKDAKTILADSVAAMRSARSAHMAGDITTSDAHVLLNIDIAGKDAISGTFTIDGTPVRITTSGGNSYLAGRALWNKVDPSGKAGELFGERCVLVPPTFPGAASILSGISQISDLNGLADSLSKPKGTVSKGSITSTGGSPAITIKDSESTLYVATQGRPYPLRVEMSGSDGGHLDFAYNRRITVAPPADCLDVSKLGVPPPPG